MHFPRSQAQSCPTLRGPRALWRALGGREVRDPPTSHRPGVAGDAQSWGPGQVQVCPLGHLLRPGA